jgi:hypothetical protein
MKVSMIAKWLCVFCALTTNAAAADEAADWLTKAVEAFRKNEPKQKHWNWQTVETRELVDRSGKAVQAFPVVTSESVIRADGRRCNAVVAWGDGKKPYLADADPDERCQAMEAIRPPFPPAGVLVNHRAKVLSRTASSVTIGIEPDKSKLKDPNSDIRCGASIRATVKLDATTSFPLRIEGEVTESGCDGSFVPVNQYETMTRAPMNSNFRRGATFWVEWSLEKDKTGDSERNFWITTAQHYSQPWHEGATVLYYWGRQVAVRHDGNRLVKDMKTTAQEFVVGSELVFK